MLILLYMWSMVSGFGGSLLGALWPVMYPEFGVSLSSIGIFSWIGSVVSLLSNVGAGWALRRFGARRMTALCGFCVAIAHFGFSLSGEYWMLCLLSIPAGFAGGIIGVSMNNYVALHYASHHMSLVHCMWGVGSILGPNLVAYTLRSGYTWHLSYEIVAIAWALYAAGIVILRKYWKQDVVSKEAKSRGLSLGILFRIRGAKEAMMTFFCYNALEQGVIMWMSSYMVLSIGLSEDLSAAYASLFFIGITVGRMFNSVLTVKFKDDHLILIGCILIAAGGVVMLLPFGKTAALISLLLIGFGCAPVCPCLLHATPTHFGAEHSQSLIGLQVAASSLGNCVLPSLFGIAANRFGTGLLPAYVFFCLALMLTSHLRLIKLTATDTTVHK